MTKINSQYIKSNVKCTHCQSQNIKRTHKQTFKSGINSNLDFQEEKFEWRQFECKDCGEITNVLNTENAIQSISEEPILPFSAFNYCVFIDHDMVSLTTFYKGSVKGNIIEDDIREEHIFLFEKLFEKNNIEACNIMENVFELSFNKEKHDFNSNEEVINYLNSLMEKTGSTFSQNLLDSYQDEEFENMDWKEDKIYAA